MLRESRRPTHLTKPLFLIVAGACLGACALPTAASAQSASASAPAVSNTRKPIGLKTAVVAATDTGGEADIAMRALEAANIAMARSDGYALMSPTTVASSLKKSGLRYPYAPRDYENVRRSLDKANRIVAVTVTPGDISDSAATYKALVEMYDTNNGGLVGRGEASFTADVNSPALVSTTTRTTLNSASPAGAPVLGSFDVPAGTAAAPVTTTTATTTTTTTTVAAPVAAGVAPRFLAVDGAVLRAVAEMNEPAQLTGIVVSLPAQHMARLSLGEMNGLRNGSRVEYLVRGTPIAYGTVVDVGQGEAVATVAPERAFPFIEINSDWRTASIPSAGAAGLTRDQIDAREWKRFERDFGISAAIAGVAYLLYTGS
jgi:hypothetical protein